MNSSFRFRNHLFLAGLIAACPVPGHTAAAARVEFAAGNVLAVSSSGQRPLSRGSELNAGETINTGNGRAQLRFADGALMSLQPQTEFRIDDYNYNGKNDGQEKGVFSLVRGGLRTITGQIGKATPDSYKVTTPVAMIGIRGTEWSGVLVPASGASEEPQLNLGTGEGAIEVCNAAGCLVVASGESAVVSGSSPPRRSEVRPALPPAATTNSPPAEAAYSQTEDRSESGELLIVEKNTPPSTPVPASGTAYALAWSGLYYDGTNYSLRGDNVGPSSVTLVDGKLVTASGSVFTFSTPVAVVSEEGSATAVLGWGRWISGAVTGGGSEQLKDAHFVLGTPTPAAQIAEISGSYNYTRIGATTPTSSALGNGVLNSASLAVQFHGAAGFTTTLNVSVTAAGRTFNANGTGAPSIASTFSGQGSGSVGAHAADLQYQGLLAGPNARFAGVTYGLTDSSDNAKVHGAIGFSRGGMTAP